MMVGRGGFSDVMAGTLPTPPTPTHREGEGRGDGEMIDEFGESHTLTGNASDVLACLFWIRYAWILSAYR